MELTSRLIVIAFGLWLVCVSVFIFARPELALKALRRFASTNLINYSELTLRLIAGLGLVGLAQHTDYVQILRIGGGFFAFTAIVLMLIPRKWHHAYAVYWADKMKPWMARLSAPFSLVLGVVLVWLATR